MNDGQVLVINSGSSSIKYQLVNPVSGAVAASGLVEQIGEADGRVRHHHGDNVLEHCGPIVDHADGLRLAYLMLDKSGLDADEMEIKAVGHRVVHGGRLFQAPTLVTDAVATEIEQLSDLAPLHNTANAIGINIARKYFPDVPHVAVFDTGFFHTLPSAAATYAINHDIAEAFGVRRYGAHGTSHEYVSTEVAHFLGRDVAELKSIVLHLGNGASASAIRYGNAVETSMGLTPLEGLVMGTRSGDIDAGVLTHLRRTARMDVEQLDELLNKMSGLRGMCGVNDFRDVMALIESGDERAKLAYEVYIHRIRKYIGAYLAVLGGADTIAFTAGVGENVAAVREDALSGFDWLGIKIDPERNRARKRSPRIISSDDSSVAVLVVPTNEELAIARAAWQFV
jgi:acetate kinase